MRISIVTTGGRDLLKRWEPGDPQLGPAVHALVQGFRELPEHEVHVLIPMRKNAQPAAREGNVIYHDVPTPMWGMRKSLYLGAASRVKKKLLEIQPDIVHGQGSERECGICAILSGFPNVMTVHGNMNALAKLQRERIGSYTWLAALLEDFTLRRTQGIICISEYVENLVRKYGVPTWFIPNAIQKIFFESPRENTSPPERPLLINVGVISERKRQQQMLRVLESLRDKGLNFEMVFVGRSPSGTYSREFHAMLESANLRFGDFQYLENLDDDAFCRLFDRASAMIHFSSEESFGLTFAEAIARGLFLFASDVGAIRQIADGVTRVQIFPVDDWDGLERGIHNWIISGAWKEPRPTSAPAPFVAKYHPVSVARQHLRIYQEILNRGNECHIR
jgi:glycosyltransferase involved in cell wall biosynthesis